MYFICKDNQLFRLYNDHIIKNERMYTYLGTLLLMFICLYQILYSPSFVKTLVYFLQSLVDQTLLQVSEDLVSLSFLHLHDGEPTFAQILNTSSNMIDIIIEQKETIVRAGEYMYRDGSILAVMT